MDVSRSSDAVIAAGRFKAVCLNVLDDVAATREPVTITKRGVAVARLVPIEPDRPLFGVLAGTVHAEGDLISPLAESWAADQ